MAKHDPVLMVTVGVLEARGARFTLLPGGRIGVKHKEGQDEHLLEALSARKPELLAFLQERARISKTHNPTSRAALALHQGEVAAEYLQRGEPFTLDGITFLPGMF